MLQALRGVPDIESHLVISPSGVLNIKYELDITRQDVHALADKVYSFRDVGATLASGSFATVGMVVVPCSMRTLAAVAHGLSDNLITRAADVTLKERRRLVMMVRETPLNLAHLRNMTAVTEMGGMIFPPLPAFYLHPKTLDDIVDHTVARVLELFDIHVPGPHWDGMQPRLD
jgi:4-hydroxy-3-polyprenylbenzoate decarboxylase